MNWINQYGDLFSAIGLILTFITFVGVWCNRKDLEKLNTKNFKINRMPDNLEDLKVISNTITDLMKDFEHNKKEIKKELCKIQPILKSLCKSLKKEDFEYLNALKNSLDNIDNWAYEESNKKWFQKKRVVMSKSLVEEIEIKITRLITDIENIGKDNSKNLL